MKSWPPERTIPVGISGSDAGRSPPTMLTTIGTAMIRSDPIPVRRRYSAYVRMAVSSVKPSLASLPDVGLIHQMSCACEDGLGALLPARIAKRARAAKATESRDRIMHLV